MLIFLLAWIFPEEKEINDPPIITSNYTINSGILPRKGTFIAHKNDFVYINGGLESVSGMSGYFSCGQFIAGMQSNDAISYTAITPLDYIVMTPPPEDLSDNSPGYVRAVHGVEQGQPNAIIMEMECVETFVNGSAVLDIEIFDGVFKFLYILSCSNRDNESIPDSRCFCSTSLSENIDITEKDGPVELLTDQKTKYCKYVNVDWISILTLAFSFLNMIILVVRGVCFIRNLRRKKQPQALTATLVNTID
jgi:hypothetical protein